MFAIADKSKMKLVGLSVGRDRHDCVAHDWIILQMIRLIGGRQPCEIHQMSVEISQNGDFHGVDCIQKL